MFRDFLQKLYKTDANAQQSLAAVKTKMMRLKGFILALSIALCGAGQSASAYCYQEAGKKYGIDPMMLQAIAYTESGFRANIESPTDDIGLMGINRSWLPILNKRFGLTEQDVWQPCTNVHIGAWILANTYKQLGKSWNAVGAYAAACTRLKGEACRKARMTYANKVYKNWLLLTKQKRSP